MEIFFASTLLVAVAEIGDKTMLLAILLATRFKKPLPVIAGIFPATIANHALPAWAGSALASIFMSDTFRIAVAIGFIAMAAWTLIPMGTLIRIGNEYLFSGEWWITVWPGLTLVVLVLSANLLGDWLRDALNPRLQ